MIRRLTKVQLALFLVITVVATSVLSASYVGLTERLFGTGPTVVADLASSGGIFAGAEVTYRGVRVGRVSELTLSADGVRVHAKLETGTEVPTDTRAVVENRSAVGEQYLDLQPRREGEPYLGDGDVIPRDATETPLRVDQLLLDVDRTVRSVPKDDLSTVVDELGTGFEGTGDDLGRLIDDGDALTQSAIEALPDTIALLKSGKVVLDTQRDTASQIKTFSGNLARISETLKASDPDLRVVLDRGTVASEELEAVVRENRESLGVLLANLVTVGQVTSARVDGIDQLLITYPEVVAGGYTVVPGDGSAHFGLQLAQSPAPLHPGLRRHDEDRPQQDLRASPGQHGGPVHPAPWVGLRRPGRPERAGRPPGRQCQLRHGLRTRPRAPRDDRVRCSGQRVRPARTDRQRRLLVMDPGGGSPMTSTVRLLWALVALVVVATLGLGATRGRDWYEARQVEQAQREALAAGRQLAVNFATLDYRHVDEDTAPGQGRGDGGVPRQLHDEPGRPAHRGRRQQVDLAGRAGRGRAGLRRPRLGPGDRRGRGADVEHQRPGR